MDGTHSFGYWLRRRRKALDLTQAALAQRVNCSLHLIQKIETDARRPSRQIAEKLAATLGLDAAERVAFVEVARAERAVGQLALPAQPVEQPQHSPRTNLLAQLTALIGREREIASLCALLRRNPDARKGTDIRLLTLTGPGGVGKTRLGLQVAADLVEDFTDGVYFVDLAPIREPPLVISAIAQTLGVRETGGQPLVAQLKQFLVDKRLLLLLDNFEQVLAAASLLTELLVTAPQLKILITSREHLHLRGEQEFEVQPLALPDPTILPALDQVSRYAAVALFIERAQASQPDFELTHANAPAIAEICVRLDGLPLAIELAGARIKLFAPNALLARLSSPLALLCGGARDVPARQQTMRATIAWSYGLLNDTEQMLFRRLGVFVGGCTLEAATHVVSIEFKGMNEAANQLKLQHSELKTLEGLATLLDKSLLRQREDPDGTMRFTILETIREYALEQLEASGEVERLRRQHARYYLTLGEMTLPEDIMTRPVQLAHLDRDYDNLWAALEWSQTTAGDSEAALRLAELLSWLWFDRGIRHEAIAMLQRTLDHPLGVGRTVAHALARVRLANLLGHTGNYRAAQAQYEQALPLASEQGNSSLHAWILSLIGWLAREQGDSTTAWVRLTEGIALFRELGDASNIAQALNTLAEVAILDEDPARAEALLAESRALWQNDGSSNYYSLVAWRLNHLGHAAQLRGEYQRAAELHQESLAIFRSLGDHNIGLPWAYHGLGETALGLRHLDEAARWLAQGLALSYTLSAQASSAWCLAGLGSVAALEEQPERAARLWGAAERLRQVISCRPAPAARTTYEQALATAHAMLGEQAFTAVWTAGRALTVEQAFAEAMDNADASPIT